MRSSGNLTGDISAIAVTMKKQQTIAETLSLKGTALQSGSQVEITLRPADEGEGIFFRRTDLANKPVMRLPQDVCAEDSRRCSVISSGGASVQTIEHLLAALWALEIDNIGIDVKGEELPALGGAALGFWEALKSAGVKEQKAERGLIEINAPESVRHGDSSLELIPSDSFTVSYLIDYPVKCIGRQNFFFDPARQGFREEIAPARTFCMKAEAEALLKMGFGRGADVSNTLVLEEDGPVGTKMIFDDEPARHKVLDLLGDLYLLAKPLKCRVVAVKSGHLLNCQMVRKVFEKYLKQ